MGDNPEQQETFTTFGDVARAYREHLLLLNVAPTSLGPHHAVLQLSAAVGELSNLSMGSSNGTALSAFERTELVDVIGALAIAVALVGEQHGVDPGEAAVARLQRLKRKFSKYNAAPASAAATGTQGAAGRVSSITYPPPSPRRDSGNPTPRAEQQASLSSFPTPRIGAGGPAGRFDHGNGSIGSVSAATTTLQAVVAGGRSPASGLPRPYPLTPETAPDTHAAQRKQSSPENSPAPLSPNTLVSFFPMLECIERYDMHPSEFDALSLTFCIPHEGQLVDLVPGGRHKHVSKEQFPEFLRLVQPYRPASLSSLAVRGSANGLESSSPANRQSQQQPQQPQPQHAASASMFNPQQFQHFCPQTVHPPTPMMTKVVEVRTSADYDPDRVGALFSPTHFTKDLFSPHSSEMRFNVEYAPGMMSPTAADQSDGPTPSGAASSASTAIAGATASTLPPALSGSVAAARAQPSAPVATAVTTALKIPEVFHSDAERVFWGNVKAVINKQVPPAGIASLRLTFALPSGNELLPLIGNGSGVPVTSNNFQQFTEILAKFVSDRQSSGQPFWRTSSMRTLEVKNMVQDPHAVTTQFSPTHHSLNLFAPHSQDTTFTVDYDEDQAAAFLPPSLKDSKIVQFPTATHYVEWIQIRPDTFKSIFQLVLKFPECLSRFQVSWCVPAQGGTIEDLIPGGRSILVSAADHVRYTNAVLRKYPELHPDD